MSDPTIDKLGSAIQDFLTSLYPPLAGATSVFAAQPGGLPVDTSAFASNLLLAEQEINDLADITARVLSGQFWPTLIKASGLYEILLSSMPTGSMTNDQLSEFGQLRSSADADYHNLPNEITATPANWWDMTANGNWTTHTTSSDEITGTLPVPVLPWHWRVLPVYHLPILQGGLRPGIFPVERALSIVAARSPQMATSPLSAMHMEMPGLHQIMTTPGVEAASIPSSTVQPISTMMPVIHPIAQPVIQPVIQPVARPISMLASQRVIAQLISVSSTQMVEAERISVSFDYCLVKLSRTWWNELFVAIKGWYIPTYGAGNLAAGSVDGSEDQCPTIPSAMFLVRNVSISGSWSEQDRTVIPSAASFGPISLIGRSIDSNLTITIPGMQIVGWMADILPALPPMSDPNLGTLGEQSTSGALASLPVLSSGQQGPAVARLQGLLRAALPDSTDASLPIDGNYGPGTVSAVQSFQQQNGLNATGLVDEAMWQKLLGL